MAVLSFNYRHIIYCVLILQLIKENKGAEDDLEKIRYQPDFISCRRRSIYCYCAGPHSLYYKQCKPCAISNNECVENCPESYLRTTTGNCTTACPTSEPYIIDDGQMKRCVSECPNQYFLLKGHCTRCAKECHEGCVTSGTSVDNCNKCSYAQHYDSCVLKCPNSTVRVDDTCMPSHYCLMVVYDGDCIQKCPVRTYRQKDDIGLQLCLPCNAQCAQDCTGPGTDQCRRCKHLKYGNQCIDECPRKAPWISNGQCQSLCPRLRNNETCVDTCPKDTFQFHNECVSSCPNDAPFKYQDSCYTLCPHFFINDSCVEKCPDGRYGFNHSCVTQCPLIARYIDGDECISSCDKLKYKNNCVSACPKRFYVSGDECVSSCPTWEPLRNASHCVQDCGSHFQLPVLNETLCVKSCPSLYYKETKTCTRHCSSNHPYKNPKTRECESNCTLYLVQGRCRETCPRFLFAYQHQCLPKCPTGLLEYRGKTPGQCVSSCPPDAMYRDGNRCVSCCPSHAVQHNCTENCPDKMFTIVARRGKDCEFLQCVFKCPSDIISSLDTCVPRCRYQESVYNGTCVSKCPMNARLVLRDKYAKCVSKCPASFVISPANERKWPSVDTCEQNCKSHNTGGITYRIYNSTCFPNCPSDYPFVLVSNNTCMKRCPSDTFYFKNTCVTKCHSGYKYYVSNMTCIQSCPKDVQFELNNTCVAACPSGTFYFQNSCVSKCNSGFSTFMLNMTCVSSCPESAKFVFSDTCVPGCPPETLLWDKLCVNQCAYPYKEYNRTCVMTCPDEKPFDFNHTCVNQCSSKTVFHSGGHGVECRYQCPEKAKYRHGRNCTSCCPSYALSVSCMKSCPKGMFELDVSNVNCTWIDCVPKCPSYHSKSKCTSGCSEFSEGKTCVESCNESTLFQTKVTKGDYEWFKCIHNCPIGQLGYEDRCVTPAECQAPYGIAFNYTKCAKHCSLHENKHDLHQLKRSLQVYVGWKLALKYKLYKECLMQSQSCDLEEFYQKTFSKDATALVQFMDTYSNAAFLCSHKNHTFWSIAKFHTHFLISMVFLIILCPMCKCWRKRQYNRLLEKRFQLKCHHNTAQGRNSCTTQDETEECAPTTALDTDNLSQGTVLHGSQEHLSSCVSSPASSSSREELPLERRTRVLYADDDEVHDTDRQARWKKYGEELKRDMQGGSWEKESLLAETNV